MLEGDSVYLHSGSGVDCSVLAGGEVMDKTDIITRLCCAVNEQEWNNICDEVKAYTRTLPLDERSGDYPKWWFVDVICSIRPSWQK